MSVGSTPTARGSMTVPGVTECRPGNYVFHDFSQVNLGTCGLEDCAMTVVATVVSVPDRGRAVVDAGSKTLSSDPLRPREGGHGLVLGTRSRLARLSEEHGVIAVEPGDQFRVGDRVRLLPNHACVVSNLHDRLWVASEARGGGYLRGSGPRPRRVGREMGVPRRSTASGEKGTLVTTRFRLKSSAPLMRRARWLWRRLCHHFLGTNSGSTRVTKSQGFSLTTSSMYSRSGSMSDR